MDLRTVTVVPGITIADGFTQSPQPVASPGEFDAENCQPDRDHNQGRTGRHDHDKADQEDGNPNDGHNDAPRRFIGEMNCSLHRGACSALLAFAAFCRSLGTMIMLLRLSCLLAAMLYPMAILSADDGVLTVQVKESTANLQPGDAKQREVRLPALDVILTASLVCPARAKAAALTVSVSDTHHYYGPELLADAVSLEAAFSVPARQLAPVIISDFCVTGGPMDDQGLRLHGVATAQISMRCRDENDATSLHFTSIPLPVRLYCRPDAAPEASSTDK